MGGRAHEIQRGHGDPCTQGNGGPGLVTRQAQITRKRMARSLRQRQIFGSHGRGPVQSPRKAGIEGDQSFHPVEV